MDIVAAGDDAPVIAPISPIRELGAYEALWLERGASFKTLAERFAKYPDALPSDFVSPSRVFECAELVFDELKRRDISRIGIRVNHAGDYPDKLRDARHPIELLYYRGAWELTETPCVAVVGSRRASDEGMARARRLAHELVAKGFTVVSGLATGIDTAAHKGAIEAGGRTIAVIGTPIHLTYPKENANLQSQIMRQFLALSQVPLLRYDRQTVNRNRLFFPERNKTMSALTDATVIVEAGETSGTLTQARAAMYQGRKLFILDSCFRRGDITWPARFAQQGAIRVKVPEDIWNNLA